MATQDIKAVREKDAAALKDELASLKIDKDDRAGGRRGGWIGLVAVVALLLAVGGGWFWSQRVQAAPVKTATVAAAAQPRRGVPGRWRAGGRTREA